MLLKRLSLQNFQGIQDLSFDFDGSIQTIYGTNATGKTTIYNALTWILFDKSSIGIKGFTPKTNDAKGAYKHNLEHLVEATFLLNSGQILKLKKIYKEVYKKKRGAMAQEFDGHTINYFIDDVPCGTEKEYNRQILSLCNNDIEAMKSVTMIDYFADEISWNKRREILFSICGDIDDMEVIESNVKLFQLKKYLVNDDNLTYKPDEYKKVALAKIKEINKMLNMIPSRIDEVYRLMPKIVEYDIDEIEEQIVILKNRKKQVEIERTQALLNNDSSVLRQSISNLKVQLAQEKAKYTEDNSKVNESLNNYINQIRAVQNEIKVNIQDVSAKIVISNNKLNTLNETREKLLNEYNKLLATYWDTDKEICPTCKQALLYSDIEKLKNDFENNKKISLEKINQKGKTIASKEMILSETENIVELTQQLDELTSKLNNAIENENTLRNNLKEVEPFEKTQKCIMLCKQIQKQEDALESDKSIYEINKMLDTKIKSIESELEKFDMIFAKVELFEQSKKREKELLKEEMELKESFEYYESAINLCELFIKTKASLITKKINDKFDNVRFKLFIEQVNGGLKEDCEVLVKGENNVLVPYQYANTAGKINTGLEIIQLLSKHYNLVMPIFVDNAESVTKLNQMNQQLIRLQVSEEDKILRIV